MHLHDPPTRNVSPNERRSCRDARGEKRNEDFHTENLRTAPVAPQPPLGAVDRALRRAKFYRGGFAATLSSSDTPRSTALAAGVSPCGLRHEMFSDCRARNGCISFQRCTPDFRNLLNKQVPLSIGRPNSNLNKIFALSSSFR